MKILKSSKLNDSSKFKYSWENQYFQKLWPNFKIFRQNLTFFRKKLKFISHLAIFARVSFFLPILFNFANLQIPKKLPTIRQISQEKTKFSKSFLQRIHQIRERV